jgi:RNA ligase
MNLELLKEMLNQNLVRVQKHPDADLFIYNYTQEVQFNRLWNECTMACRGLILDAEQNVVARPFNKFFNLGEMENQIIPSETFDVFEKMDGSLGILYWLNGKPFIATRGSFESEQALKATEILHSKYFQAIEFLDQSKTYLFEIIYPSNRIVIDYGRLEALILLGIVDTKIGEEFPLVDIGFPIVKKYDGLNDLFSLKKLEEDNKEGFVVRFKNGYRLKVKFEEYQRIHRIVTGVSNISIWEYLKTGQSLNEIIERVPDEFYDWVKKTSDDLKNKFNEIEKQSKDDFKILADRKETALYFQTCKYPAVLFRMLDEKNHDEVIWKMLRPEFSKPFSNKFEN